ncbi:MAG: AAA family ATPase [Desulfobacula sp.]|nr:AAA family ATPase [Desulfobacula sp.]
MKLLELRFKNLNSLAGEWIIDFTAPEYVSDGIFAITGPTGAGKSTLLDAVCLALYGRTPRLKVISKSTNEIMSRQTGECFAEVTFETLKGQFRCHWSQRRAGKKPNGNLQDAKHEICDALTGQILESKKREVAARVEKATGMDFDRFTRSTLLAQGGFAAFLSAAADQRAPILEQITGTSIYSEISKQVHEHQRAEQKTLELIEAQIGGIQLLSKEDENVFKTRLERKQARIKEIQKEGETFGQWIQWRKNIDDLVLELTSIEKEKKRQIQAVNAFEPDRIKLEKALQAARLDSDYAILIQLRQQQKKEKAVLSKARLALPKQEKELVGCMLDLENAKKANAKDKDRLKKEQVLLKSVRANDLKLSEIYQRIDSEKKECRVHEKKLADQDKAWQKIQKLRQELDSQLLKINVFLKENEKDADLVSLLAGMKEKINSFDASTRKRDEKKTELFLAKKQFDIQVKNKEKLVKVTAKTQTMYKASQDKVSRTTIDFESLLKGRLLREYRSEHDHLLKEAAYLNTIKSLEEHRVGLENGRPCPLCGAVDHPFLKDNVPDAADIQDRIQKLAQTVQKAEDLENALSKDKEKERLNATALVGAEKQLAKAVHLADGAKQTCSRLEKEVAEVLKESEQLKQSLFADLSAYGVKEDSQKDFAAIINDLEKQKILYIEQQNKKETIQKKINDYTSKINGFEAVVKTLDQTLIQKHKSIKDLNEHYETLHIQRKKMYGQKNPDKEEARLEDMLTRSETALEKARRQRDHAKTLTDRINHEVRSLNAAVETRHKELEICEPDFCLQMKKLSFKDETTFLSLRLPRDERQDLVHKAKVLDNRQVDIEARKKDRDEKLSKARAENKTSLSMEALEGKLLRRRESYKALGEEIGAIKQQLTDDKQAKKGLKEKMLLLEHQKRECRQWDKLHALIGSADGKKYRNFAQGLTFDLMISHANQQLTKMTDRYLLVRDDKQPLELNILDNYQAGEIRSTKNLSGGESFLVSLCLALGLSNMASRNVRVDSLFLDEGFGTLDEAALETALEVLAGLQQHGKLIGVISHVPAIKERIPTQVVIEPLSGGNSIIVGPGCRSL